MKATKRAKRLEKYLSETLGWSTADKETKCSNCWHKGGWMDKYCSECGHKVKEKATNLPDILADLELAISYALGEKSK